MDKYVIINEEDGMMLAHIGIKRIAGNICHEHAWTRITADALHWELEEAEAVITFISDVIDWEMAEQLHAEPLKI